MAEDDYEYPIWKKLEGNIDRLEHVYIQNESAVYEDMTYTPDCIIWFGGLPEDSILCHGQYYQQVFNTEDGKYLFEKRREEK